MNENEIQKLKDLWVSIHHLKDVDNEDVDEEQLDLLRKAIVIIENHYKK